LSAAGWNFSLFTPSSLNDVNMFLFKGSTLNYLNGSQLVLGSGFFASSPAQLKSIAAGSGLNLTDANGVLTLSANAFPNLTQRIGFDAYGHIVLSYDFGLDVNASGQLVVDNGAIQQLLSWTAPLVNSNHTVSLSLGLGLKVDSNNAFAVDTTTIEPRFSPQLPLALTGFGTANAKLKLNTGWALKLDGNNLAVDASVLGFSSGDGGTTWKIGFPNLPTIPGISVTGGNPTLDYTVIQQPIAVVAPILFERHRQKDDQSRQAQPWSLWRNFLYPVRGSHRGLGHPFRCAQLRQRLALRSSLRCEGNNCWSSQVLND
jgi:hypothetical protein